MTFRPCTEQSLDEVERLYLEYLHSQPNYVPGESHLESLIRPLWRVNPGSFLSLWNDDRLVAFCACIRLTEETVPIFRSNPITAPAAGIYDPGQQQYLVCLAGVDPKLEAEISGTVARALVRIVDIKGALIVDLISFPHWGLRLTLEEAMRLVKLALKNHSSLPMQPKLADTLRPLVPMNKWRTF